MIQICDHKLLIFQLLLLMSVLASETTEILTFTGYEGGKVEIRCPYDSGYEEQNKYLCRGECKISPWKDIPVESGSPAKDERFSLTDDTTARVFTVTITDLRTEDQGRYWCAVKTGLLLSDKYTEIYLEMKPVCVVSRVTGQHLKISCKYKSDLKNMIKFMCKESDRSLCETSAIKVSSETNRNGRFSLRDDESAGVFTVTITDLTLEDSGKYWCGAGERGLKIKWISVTHLNIYYNTSARMSREPITTASDHMTKPANEDTSSIRPVTSSSSSSSSYSSVSSSSPELQLVNIMPSVMVILMVFGLSLLVYFGLRHKRKGVWMKGVVHFSTENLLTEGATHTICHYEEIMSTDTHHGYSLGRPVFDELNASDSLNYSTVIFQTTDHSARLQ